MRANINRQRGLGLLGWIVVLAVASFFLTCAFRIGPLYIDYWTVESVLEGALEEEGLERQSKHEIRSAIQRRFDTNRVEVIKAREIRFEETRDKLVMDAGYEQRVPLIGNIDVVVRFEQLRYEIPR